MNRLVLLFVAFMATFVALSSSFRMVPIRSRFLSVFAQDVNRDTYGYEVKPRDWFNGLSGGNN